jgi:hypothetical protein
MNPYEYHPESPMPLAVPSGSLAVPDPQRDAIQGRVIQLRSLAAQARKKLETGANWFYWVAGLSAVNSVLMHVGADWTFIVGLATTLIVDGIAAGVRQNDPALTPITIGIAVVINAVILGLVALTGWLSSQGWRSVMAVGMGLYLLDGIIFLMFGDFLSAGFHGFALWNMWNGFSAAGELEGLEAELTHLSYLLPQEAQLQPPSPVPAPYFPQG